MADDITLPGTGENVAADEISSKKYQRIKLIHGADGVNAGDVSTANPLPVFDPDLVGTGTITVTDSVVSAPAGAGAFVTGASTAGSLVYVVCPGGDAAWNVQITALTSGTLYFEGSLDSTTGTDGNWINLNGRRTGIVNTQLAGNATANGMYRGNTSGLKYFRVRSVGSLTGTPAIVIRISSGIGAIFLNASIPAGTNLIGSTSIDQTTPGTTNAVVAGGNIAHDGVDSGNPVKLGLRALAHGTNPTAVAAADRTDWLANRAGIPWVIGGHPNVVCYGMQITAAVTNAVIGPTVASGLKFVCTGVSFVLDNASTNFPSVVIGFGTASTPAFGSTPGTAKILAGHPSCPAGGGMTIGDGSGIIGIGGDDEEVRITTVLTAANNGLFVLLKGYTIES